MFHHLILLSFQNVVLQEFRTSENIHQPDSTPISSRVINKRTDPNLKEALEKPLEKTSNEPHRASNSDYTTKLFRKDISSHSPRAVTSKALKQSPWVQAPAADELTCSLLSDDSKVDRPERLKSLLACVSGKGMCLMTRSIFLFSVAHQCNL